MIRRAVLEDIAAMMPLCEAMHKESPNYNDVEFIYEDMFMFLTTVINSPDRCYFLAIRDDEIIGFMGAMFTIHMFNFSQGYVSDLKYYIKPEKRGGAAILYLFRRFEKWAKSKGVKKCNVSQTAGIAPEKVEELLLKMGYNRSGTVYSKEV